MVWTPKKARGDFCPESDPSSPMSRLHSVVYCPKPAETGDFQGFMVWWPKDAVSCSFDFFNIDLKELAYILGIVRAAIEGSTVEAQIEALEARISEMGAMWDQEDGDAHTTRQERARTVPKLCRGRDGPATSAVEGAIGANGSAS